MKRKVKFDNPRLLPARRKEAPVMPGDGDETFRNGIFLFNISGLQDWLRCNPQPVVEMPVDMWGSGIVSDDQTVEMADVTCPVILAEIAPDLREYIPDIPESDWISSGYVCIDGRHRMENARRLGMETLPAVVLRMEQHLPFLCSGYEQYVSYWNSKLEDRAEEAQRWKRKA